MPLLGSNQESSDSESAALPFTLRGKMALQIGLEPITTRLTAVPPYQRETWRIEAIASNSFNEAPLYRKWGFMSRTIFD